MATETSPARLDELMLAMDVVDTLRHESDLVQRELAGEERADALIVRLREIYAGQGIEVSDRVLREGVAALEQDRFVYTPPTRTLGVWLAELYVTRSRWAPIVAIAGVAILGAWFAIDFGRAQQQRMRNEGLAARYRAAVSGIEVARGEFAQLDVRERHRRSTLTDVVADAAAPLWSQYRVERGEAVEAIAVASEKLAAMPAAPSHSAAALADVLALESVAQLAAREVKQAQGALVPLDELFKQGESVSAALQRLDGLATAPEAVAAVAAARDALTAAVDGGDKRDITRQLERVDSLRALLEREYTLRVVSRKGIDTGFWREPDGGGELNHYVVLEAVDQGGAIVPLEVLDEESQRRTTVKYFAQRVPLAVFERVRDDKLDNGIVDNAIAGAKRRGALSETFTIETAGGRLARW